MNAVNDRQHPTPPLFNGYNQRSKPVPPFGCHIGMATRWVLVGWSASANPPPKPKRKTYCLSHEPLLGGNLESTLNSMGT